jgi:adenine/guanine phosphoribosyltransferase-like PRPP-binding protein
VTNIEISSQIHLLLDKVEDESFLKAIHAMLSVYLSKEEDPIIGYEADGEPITASMARRELLAEVEAARRGEYTTLDDLRNEAI